MRNASHRPVIVLIEDNPSDVYLMNYALEENGLVCEIKNFQNGAEALLTLCPRQRIPDDLYVPDLILLDLNTPRSDGFEVLAQIKNNPDLAGVPVAIITSSTSPVDKRRADQLGAAMYIKKPTQLAIFVRDVGAAVKTLLGSERPKVIGQGG